MRSKRFRSGTTKGKAVTETAPVDFPPSSLQSYLNVMFSVFQMSFLLLSIRPVVHSSTKNLLKIFRKMHKHKYSPGGV